MDQWDPRDPHETGPTRGCRDAFPFTGHRSLGRIDAEHKVFAERVERQHNGNLLPVRDFMWFPPQIFDRGPKERS